MKNKRHMKILELVAMQDISTQEELAAGLKQAGMHVTQATVSRDIKELKLVKTTGAGGKGKYAASTAASQSISERLVRVFADTVLTIEYSGHIVLIKTLSGSANAAAEAVDALKWPEILGSLAGDNTIMVVVREGIDARDVVHKLTELIH